jgi:hypothetical protein
MWIGIGAAGAILYFVVLITLGLTTLRNGHGAAIAVASATILRGRGGDPIAHAAGSGVLTHSRLGEVRALARDR